MEGHVAADNEGRTSSGCVFRHKDTLDIILTFLDWKDLLNAEKVNTLSFQCARTAWQSLGCAALLPEEDRTKQGVIAHVKCRQLARDMETIVSTHRLQFIHPELQPCPGCRELPPLLALEGLLNPPNYRFFVRISDHANHLLWEGYLPFQIQNIDQERFGRDYTRMRRIICCSNRELLMPIFARWESFYDTFSSEYQSLQYDWEWPDCLQNLTVTVVAFATPSASIARNQVYAPRMVCSASIVDHGTTFDSGRKVSWDLEGQPVETHDYAYDISPPFGKVGATFVLDRDGIAALELQYYVDPLPMNAT